MYFFRIDRLQSFASKKCKRASILDSGDEHQHQGSFPSHPGHIYTKSYSKDSTNAENCQIWLYIIIWPRLNQKQVQAVIPALLLSKGNIVHISRFKTQRSSLSYLNIGPAYIFVGHNYHYTYNTQSLFDMIKSIVSV